MSEAVIDKLKRCSCCKEYKTLDWFRSDVTSKDGLYSQCRICENIRQRKRSEEPKAKTLKALRGKKRRGRERNAQAPYFDIFNDPWLIEDEKHRCLLVEESRKYLSCFGNDPFATDHIIPIAGALITGYDWSGNYKNIPSKENASKGNRHWTDKWKNHEDVELIKDCLYTEQRFQVFKELKRRIREHNAKTVRNFCVLYPEPGTRNNSTKPVSVFERFRKDSSTSGH